MNDSDNAASAAFSFFRPWTTPAAEGTEVTWTMNGDMGKNPLFHWFALFADGMVGKDFEAGLSNLKAVAEQPS